MEVHKTHDQFIRIEQGKADVVLDGEKTVIENDFAIVLPVDTGHHIIIVEKKIKLC